MQGDPIVRANRGVAPGVGARRSPNTRTVPSLVAPRPPLPPALVAGMPLVDGAAGTLAAVILPSASSASLINADRRDGAAWPAAGRAGEAAPQRRRCRRAGQARASCSIFTTVPPPPRRSPIATARRHSDPACCQADHYSRFVSPVCIVSRISLKRRSVPDGTDYGGLGRFRKLLLVEICGTAPPTTVACCAPPSQLLSSP